ncbi:MAG: EcsC family protein [Aestuariivita sp.]|uniref:EcsC family protein n=1 Tax=Aestuariivita sp. TaxID=1872407 RepID=UPI003BAE17E7
MTDIILTRPLDVDKEMRAIAARYRAAAGPGIQVLNLLGGQAENLLDRLPDPVRARLDVATQSALVIAMDAAESSRRAVPDQAGWLNTVVATAMGAAGGFGGLPTALVELPVTTTVLLRTIQGVAAEQGFDPSTEGVRFDCLTVFGSAGPLAHDDGADLGFLSVRLALSGRAMQKMIAAVAPRLGAALGQKLAAQTVPVLGAVAGAATNYAFTNYYQQMAHVHFRLRRLAIDADIPHEELVARLAEHLGQPIPGPS